MCLIILKPQGVSLPPVTIMTVAHKNNPHGFGLAYSDGVDGTVHIRKGAMTLGGIYHILRSVPNIEKQLLMMHFRFATSGTINPANCHPFPITNKEEFVLSTSVRTSCAIAHNGVIFGFERMESTYLDKKLSDTQQFILYYMSRMGASMFNKGVLELIADSTSSKFALLTPDKFHLVGEFLSDKGCYYSNTSYSVKNYYGRGMSNIVSYCEICGTLEFSEHTITLTKGVSKGCTVCSDCAMHQAEEPDNIF